ncbi:MAG: hypothetical protein AAGG55_11770 [Pseudomonadota bacterium]
MSSADSERYDIAFSGECLEGFAEEDVRAAVGTLFKADDATLARLFSGKPQRIKRNVDRATALKYQKAMNNAGARVSISEVAAETSASQSATQPTPAATASTSPPLKEPVASPEVSDLTQEADSSTTSSPSSDIQAVPLNLEPVGSDVLRPDERAPWKPRDVATDHLSVAASGTILSDPAPAPTPPPVPDLTVADVGTTLAPQPKAAEALDLDVSAISLAPEGHDLSDCAPEQVPEADIDLTHLQVDAAGADLLRDDERAVVSATAPNTDHLVVEDLGNS